MPSQPERPASDDGPGSGDLDLGSFDGGMSDYGLDAGSLDANMMDVGNRDPDDPDSPGSRDGDGIMAPEHPGRGDAAEAVGREDDAEDVDQEDAAAQGVDQEKPEEALDGEGAAAPNNATLSTRTCPPSTSQPRETQTRDGPDDEEKDEGAPQAADDAGRERDDRSPSPVDLSAPPPPRPTDAAQDADATAVTREEQHNITPAGQNSHAEAASAEPSKIIYILQQEHDKDDGADYVYAGCTTHPKPVRKRRDQVDAEDPALRRWDAMIAKAKAAMMAKARRQMTKTRQDAPEAIDQDDQEGQDLSPSPVAKARGRPHKDAGSAGQGVPKAKASAAAAAVRQADQHPSPPPAAEARRPRGRPRKDAGLAGQSVPEATAKPTSMPTRSADKEAPTEMPTPTPTRNVVKRKAPGAEPMGEGVSVAATVVDQELVVVVK